MTDSPPVAPVKDVFVSYKREDAERVKILVDALERSGFSVWWDPTIAPGDTWPQVIEDAINTCPCVLVVWSELSVPTTAKWVHREARRGEQRGVLLPVAIDDVGPPFGFDDLQAARLVGWDGVSANDQYALLVQKITDLLEAQPPAEGESGTTSPRKRRPRGGSPLRRAISLATIALSIAGIAALLLAPSGPVDIELSNLELSGLRLRLAPGGQTGGTGSVLVLQEMPVRQLVAFDLQSVDVPTSDHAPGVTYAQDPIIQLSAVDSSSAIDLTGLELPVGAEIELQRTTGGTYQMAVRGATEAMRISVSGPIEATTEEGVDTLDFGVPGRVGLRPDSSFTLEFEPQGADVTLFTNLRIDDLRLYRVDQDVGLDKTALNLVSTIESGTMAAPWMGGAREIGSGEGLRFASFSGEVEKLRLVGDTLVLDARGRRVTGLRSGLQGDGESLMPTRLGSLSGTGKLLVALGLAVYLVGLVLLTRRLWRRSI